MQNQTGITLVELMITLALIAVLSAIAIPRLNNLPDNNRLVNYINTLSANLQYSRSEAIRRVRNVTMATLDGSNNWQMGWQVFTDLNSNGVADAGEILRIVDPLGNKITFVGSGPSPIVFTPNGRSNVVISTGDTFSLCQVNRVGSYGKLIRLFPLGRLDVETLQPCT